MSRRLVALFLGGFAWALLIAAPHGAARQSSTAAPQGARVTISGSVVDGALTPLAGVAITLERAGRVEARTTTDGDGKFRFTAVAAGDYRVRAAHAGFSEFSRDVRIPAGLTAIQLPIVMARPNEAAQSKAEGGVFVDGISPVGAPPPAPQPAAAAAPRAASGAAGGAGAGGGRGGSANSPAVVSAQPVFQGQSAQQSFSTPEESAWLDYRYPYPGTGENYAHVDANRFQSTREQPLSTFGADVDTASYSNVRRFLSSGQLPPSDAVRIEELVNYFRFAYAEPRDGRPIALTTEIGDCPWAPSHKLVLIGARAKAPAPREIGTRNIVLLIDVSGSMQPAERLPLIKTALRMFVDTLRPDDRIAIVTYAGSSGVALPSTEARYRDVIQRAIAGLSAGGSTNGGQGLLLAYRAAREAFIPGGVNRVILATDGDFNVGIVNQRDLLHLIDREKDSGVFLSVFGVGSGNLKDATMEMLADRGNGHYAYLDSLQEARRVLVREGGATLETVAKDVKFQVEFNPALVSAWKLLGYENRALAARDFNNDRKDAGDMGAGHTVTVLYEVVPSGAELEDDRGTRPTVDPLRYQAQPSAARPATDASRTGEWLTVKTRYKAPEGEASDLLTQTVRPSGRVQHLPFASAVAQFGLLLRSQSRSGEQWTALARRVEAMPVPAAMTADKEAFKELVETAAALVRIR